MPKHIDIDNVSIPNVVMLKLSGGCDVRIAAELQNTLIALSASAASVRVDLSAIDSLDASCLQLLVAAKKELESQFTIYADADSEAARWISIAGLTEQLGVAT